MRLADAATTAFALAQRDKLALAAIAKRDPRGPVHWFAANMLEISVVYGVPAGKSRAEQLDKRAIEGLVLTHGLDGLQTDKNKPVQFSDLRITELDLQRYLRWAKTVY
jgi:hypothetical protein